VVVLVVAQHIKVVLAQELQIKDMLAALAPAALLMRLVEVEALGLLVGRQLQTVATEVVVLHLL
jgi:hypothetical protein